MNEMITVITLAYRSMEHIYSTIDSILMQNYSPIEIVVADDCSGNFDEEGIKRYIEKYKHNNIASVKVYENDINLGTVKNMNAAIKKSSGTILVNLSAGDMFFECDVLKKIADEFYKTKCELLCTRRAFFFFFSAIIEYYMPNDYETDKIMQFKSREEELQALYSGMMYNMASGCAFSYRKSMMERMGLYDEQYRLWEDGPFFTRYVLTEGMLHFNYDIVSIFYRAGGVSTGGGMSEGIRQDAIRFLKDGLKVEQLHCFTKRQMKYRLAYLRGLKHHPLIANALIVIQFPDVCVYRAIEKSKQKFYDYKKSRRLVCK